MALQRGTKFLSMLTRALGMHAPAVRGQALRGISTFDQAMQGRLASLANVKHPYPKMMEDSRKFRMRMGSPNTTDVLKAYSETGSPAVERCEVRVHLCPPPWFCDSSGVWLIGEVNGVRVVDWIPDSKQLSSNKPVATQQLDPSTRLMMEEYWKSIHGVQKNPSLWIHSHHDQNTQMPDDIDQLIAMGRQTMALLWKCGFQPNAFYQRDHFLTVLKKTQGVDVCLDLVEDAQTGIVHLEAFGFYFERTVLPAGEWIKYDHPCARVQENAYFFLV